MDSRKQMPQLLRFVSFKLDEFKYWRDNAEQNWALWESFQFKLDLLDLYRTRTSNIDPRVRARFQRVAFDRWKVEDTGVAAAEEEARRVNCGSTLSRFVREIQEIVAPDIRFARRRRLYGVSHGHEECSVMVYSDLRSPYVPGYPQ